MKEVLTVIKAATMTVLAYLRPSLSFPTLVIHRGASPPQPLFVLLLSLNEIAFRYITLPFSCTGTQSIKQQPTRFSNSSFSHLLPATVITSDIYQR